METRSRAPRFRVRTLLVAVALVGLLLALAARELHLRAELRRERDRAEANFRKAQAAVDLYYTEVAQRSLAGGSRDDELRRVLSEHALKFYEASEPGASSPAERTRLIGRMQQIRTKLEGDN